MCNEKVFNFTEDFMNDSWEQIVKDNIDKDCNQVFKFYYNCSYSYAWRLKDCEFQIRSFFDLLKDFINDKEVSEIILVKMGQYIRRYQEILNIIYQDIYNI